ncbi:UNVERIFIED_CONTAM: hypothetical protein RF648_17585 [Kocuria sp. CPCC 205274]|uniref:Uncharacterized protein n=1 Tax=Herbiconiux daphne TaxID=2970914 RepID=A0ABT2H911_9MICO|nr:hypothetical protein [Herbiconiux daphne]MCS5736377.1 hypothetical protein [Herbiconiux daphne]
MQKKITVYIVTAGESKVPFTTKSRANEAVELLAKFGVVAEITTEKRTVTIE